MKRSCFFEHLVLDLYQEEISPALKALFTSGTPKVLLNEHVSCTEISMSPHGCERTIYQINDFFFKLCHKIFI